MFSLKERVVGFQKGSADFFQYVEQMNEHIKRKMEDDDALTNMAEKALLGEREAVLFSLGEIEKYVRQHPFTGNLPPEYRKLDITGALFQEWIGYGPVFDWFTGRQYAESSQLQIVGKQVFFTEQGEYRTYPYSFSSPARAEKLQRALIRHDPSIKIDRMHPSAEFKMDDPLWPGRFIRVAIWIPERVWDGFMTMTFRRQITEYMTLEEQAGTEIIPFEAVPMLRALVKTYPNIIVSGPVNSGKTTFANTIVGEQLACAEQAVGVVMVEKHPESTLPFTVKGHRFIPIKAHEDELMDIGIQSLRHDPDVVFLTEMRYREWQFYNFAGEKGYRGLIGTYHTKEPEDIPFQGASAVHANQGGHLKAHLITSLKSCELVAVLEPLRHGKKKLVRLSEIRFEDNRVFAYDWMRWNHDTTTWEYASDISGALWERMNLKDQQAAYVFATELQNLTHKRENASPVTESKKSAALLGGV